MQELQIKIWNIPTQLAAQLEGGSCYYFIKLQKIAGASPHQPRQ
jgi:hypothetical protein